jgi:AraC family transcriptional regulator of adaptative response/methylated-DNA-[protein]-cysteine methyltransferase
MTGLHCTGYNNSKFRVLNRGNALYFCVVMKDYERIEKAIVYLKENFKEQPDLDAVAKQVHLSPFHFQRLFRDWAGVSPKKFLQFISVEYAKGLLKQNLSLADVSFETGLSGTGRLHDLFIGIEGMTPGEFKNGGEALQINYSFAATPFGEIIIASTIKGICHIAFIKNKKDAVENLLYFFPNSTLIKKTDRLQQGALRFFTGDWNDLEKIKLHLKGTAFQLKVWQSLLHIPFGNRATYSTIAANIKHPKASRAVGTAIGDNPVAFLIPCHRVIRSSGIIGDYHWGSGRKAAMLGWETAKLAPEN